MQEARFCTHKRLPVQFLDPADGSFSLGRQFNERRIAAGRSCNANIIVLLVGPLRQVGLGRTWKTAWRLLVQHFESIGEAFGQFCERYRYALLPLELTMQEADNQRGMVGVE